MTSSSNLELSPAQQRAIAFVTSQSFGPPMQPSLDVTINFHPDRLCRGLPILDLLGAEGEYRSQFETGTSNGGLTAHPGGDRWEWESRIFGGAYDTEDSSWRPKYGALNYLHKSVGGSPRFGSAYLLLHASVLERSTFCYPDSVFQPQAFGVKMHMSIIDVACKNTKDLLDDYIEAHIHGPIRLKEDVQALVLDPSFRNSSIEDSALRIGCLVSWHHGFRLDITELEKHPEYRGERFVTLGRTLSKNGFLDPMLLGKAAHEGQYDEQDLKRVWHYIARYGDLSR